MEPFGRLRSHEPEGTGRRLPDHVDFPGHVGYAAADWLSTGGNILINETEADLGGGITVVPDAARVLQIRVRNNDPANDAMSLPYSSVRVLAEY